MKLYPFLFIILLTSACGNSKKSEGDRDLSVPSEGSHHLDVKVAVDGNENEWPQPLPGYSKETTLHFGVTNDKDYLYVAVACSEDRTQRKMLRSGMELYISEDGKKQTATGISFPIPATKTTRQELPAGEIKTPDQMARDVASAKNIELTQMQTFGLSKTADGIYPLTQTDCKVAYGWSDNNFFNIEYAIPLKELSNNVSVLNHSIIQIGFKLNAFPYSNGSTTRSSSNAAVGGSYGGRGMRGGGMRGGGMRGGGMGGMRQSGTERGSGTSSMADLAKDQSFWTKYTVSK